MVMEQPGGLENLDEVGPAVANRDQEGAGSSGRASASHNIFVSNEAFITRLCPNAVKVLPDPPPTKLMTAMSPRPQVLLTDAGSKDQAVVTMTYQNKQKDSRSGRNDVISMKTLQHISLMEYI